MCVVALFTAGRDPARYRGVWPVSDSGEDTLGYSAFDTLHTVVRPCKDGAKALGFSCCSALK